MENTVNTYQDGDERLIEREIYKNAYEFVKTSYVNCIETKSPKMFAVVGPGGRGKTKMCKNIINKLYNNEDIKSKYIFFDLKGLDTVESEYSSLLISAIMITEIYQYINDELKDNKNEQLEIYEKKCIELLKLWNIFSDVENLNKKITIKKAKDSVVKDTLKTALSFGESCVTSLIAIENPVLAGLYSVGVDKAKEFVEGLIDKIKLKDGDESELEEKYSDFFEQIKISQEANNSEQQDKGQHKESSKAAARSLFDSYLGFFKRVFQYYGEKPFTIVFDNAESIDFSDSQQRNTNQLKESANIDLQNYQKLFKLNVPVVWYISGQKVPFKIDKYYEDNNNLIKKLELLAFDINEIENILTQEEILVNSLPVKPNEINELLKNTSGNPLWVKMYVNQLKKRFKENKEYGDPLSLNEFYEIINESRDDLMVRLLGCNLANPILGDAEKNRILFGMMPLAPWDVFDKIAAKCSIARTKSDDIMVVESNGDTYSVHGELVTLITKTLLEYREKYDDIKSLIKTIIEATENLVYENVQSETNDFISPYLLMIRAFSSVDEINDKLVRMCTTKVNDKTLFDVNRRSIVSIIRKNINFKNIGYDNSKSQYIMLNALIEKYRKVIDLDVTIKNVRNTIQAVHFDFINVLREEKNSKRQLEYYIELLEINIKYLDNEINDARIFKVHDTQGYRFVEFVFNNCVEGLKNVQKLDNNKYLELKQTYIDKVDALEEKELDNEYITLIERTKNKVQQVEYEINKNVDEYLGYLENYVNKVISYKKNEYLFFENGNRMFYYFSVLDVNNKKTREITNRLFKVMFNEYVNNYIEYRKKHSHFIDAYTEYINKKGLTEQVEKTLLNNLVINNLLAEEIFGCLLNSYRNNIQDEKIIDLINKVYIDYSDKTKDKEKKSYTMRMFSHYNDSFVQILLRDKIFNYGKKINSFKTILFEMRDSKVISNYLPAYDFVYKAIDSEFNLDFVNELLDIYYVTAFIKYESKSIEYLNNIKTIIPENYEKIINKYNILSFNKRCMELQKEGLTDYRVNRKNSKTVNKICDTEYNLQIKLENTILLALAYLLRYNSQTNTHETFIEILEKRAEQAINDILSLERLKDFRKFNFNVYRKIINIDYITNMFKALLQRFDESIASDLLTKSLKFSEVKSADFYDKKNIYNLIVDRYLIEYHCETLNIEKTVNRLHRFDKSIEFNIHKQVFFESTKKNINNPIYYGLLTKNIRFNDNSYDESKYMDKYFGYLCELAYLPTKINKADENYLFKFYLGDCNDNAILNCDNNNLKNVYCKSIAELSMINNNEDKAIELLEKIAENGEQRQKIYIYRKISEIYKHNNEYQKAKEYLIKATKIACEILKEGNNRIHILEIYSLLSTVTTEDLSMEN